MEKSYWVYILASKRNGTLYTGLTNDLSRRVFEHKTKSASGFTRRYDVTSLVYFERFEWIGEAKSRERQLKRWRRAWKIALIEKDNPTWEDLYGTMRF